MSGITTVGFGGFVGVSGSAATLSVLLEPLLMAAAAFSNGLTRCIQSVALERVALQGLSMLGLTTVLMAVHPWF